MNISEAAFLFSTQTLGAQRLYLWTFTFAELLAVKETRKRWHHLQILMLRQWPELQGLRVFELHEEHGLHVHMLTNERIDVNVARLLAIQAGWGRIHVKYMPPEHGDYLAKYLSKKRPECFKRWRLWAPFGEGWTPTRIKDVKKESLFSKIYQACKEWKHWEGRKGFFDRMAFTRLMMFKTIENDWKPGLGPQDKPYWMCCDEELEFGASDMDAPF